MSDMCVFRYVLFQNRTELKDGAVMMLTLSPVMVVIFTANIVSASCTHFTEIKVVSDAVLLK